MHGGKAKRLCYKPTIIIHGGATAVTRANLPPDLYLQYHTSLLTYLKASKALLDHGTSAIEAACHAVTLMEDDPLFNCGKGSVFTTEGTIEMEASVMVTSIDSDPHSPGSIKRGAAVSLLTETRHPILLAKEVLLSPDNEAGLGGTSTMHCQLSGASVEQWGFTHRCLERKPKDWFWTKRRWEEHKRGLKDQSDNLKSGSLANSLPSQGTVGAVCVDSYGNLAVATSTGGMTNKLPGRIGDTPTLGAGFWAESWDVDDSLSALSLRPLAAARLLSLPAADRLLLSASSCLCDLLGFQTSTEEHGSTRRDGGMGRHRRAVAMSGTGNGDSFLRTDAVRTAAAYCRFAGTSLADAIERVAGPRGELQKSAGSRWSKTGEGEGGIIGIEIEGTTSRVVFDFNGSGMWRAWYEAGKARVMVFRHE